MRTTQPPAATWMRSSVRSKPEVFWRSPWRRPAPQAREIRSPGPGAWSPGSDSEIPLVTERQRGRTGVGQSGRIADHVPPNLDFDRRLIVQDDVGAAAKVDAPTRLAVRV